MDIKGITTVIVSEYDNNSVRMTFNCVDKEARISLYEALTKACREKEVAISFKLDC